MGIKGLAKLLSDEAPDCIREVELKSLHGRKVAIDASMQIYQFLIAIRQNNPNAAAQQLTNAEGESTSHIQGMFNRTIRFLTEGLKPVYVFDGKPPEFKSGELQKRREKREKAEAELKQAQQEGDIEAQDKQSKRLVRAGTKENDDCKKLLRLMGVPVVLAPCEAEAQAAALAKDGLVFAAGTEDMDCLTFATPVLLRKMAFANASKSLVQQMKYDIAIQSLDITHDQFVDLCILLGCDYCDSIKGIGPKTALKLIREHKDIETILDKLDKNKYQVPDNWIPSAEGEIPVYQHARRLFKDHEVLNKEQVGPLKWNLPDEEGLKKFLVDEQGFNPERVASSIDKLKKAHTANSKPQSRLDSFFTVKSDPLAAKKRKERLEKEKKAAAAAKKKMKKR